MLEITRSKKKWYCLEGQEHRSICQTLSLGELDKLSKLQKAGYRFYKDANGVIYLHNREIDFTYTIFSPLTKKVPELINKAYKEVFGNDGNS